MPSLPSNVSYGTVKGRFLLAYGDGSDGDLNPDAEAASGAVVFTPSVISLKNTSASPPVTIFPATVSCALDSDGYILGSDGTRNVRLIATDDTDNQPTGWTWEVDFRLTDPTGARVVGPNPFSFALPTNATVDITNATPVPSDPNGTYYLVAPGLASGGTTNQFLVKSSNDDYATAWSSTIFGGSA
nr:MAG TPA: hypothetical protein [Caudoviricetes sp.]